VKELSYFQLLHLTRLEVSHNCIDSIEVLCTIHIPHIQELPAVILPQLFAIYSDNNCFADAKALTEGCLPKLRRLDLCWGMLGEQKNPVRSAAVPPQDGDPGPVQC
jgi:hypothetical protein